MWSYFEANYKHKQTRGADDKCYDWWEERVDEFQMYYAHNFFKILSTPFEISVDPDQPVPIEDSIEKFGKKRWLSGREFDSRWRDCWFEPHQRRCVASLRKTLYPLLGTGSTEEDPS